MSTFRSDAREGTKYLGLGAFWWLLIVIVALVIGGLVWGFRVATSEVKGQGDAIIQRNSATNWTAAQARFEDNFAEYETTLTKIDNLAPQVAANPDSTTLTTQLNGLRSYCASVVADYNADARKFLAGDFRAADLPQEIDAARCNA